MNSHNLSKSTFYGYTCLDVYIFWIHCTMSYYDKIKVIFLCLTVKFIEFITYILTAEKYFLFDVILLVLAKTVLLATVRTKSMNIFAIDLNAIDSICKINLFKGRDTNNIYIGNIEFWQN